MLVEPFAKFRTKLERMARAVTVDEDVKSRLEERQAEIRLRTGANVTQQELLTRLIDNAYESRDDVIDSFREPTVPLTEREKEAMRRGRFSSGVETEESDVDVYQYSVIWLTFVTVPSRRPRGMKAGSVTDAGFFSDIETRSVSSQTASTYTGLTNSRRFKRSHWTAKTSSQSWSRGDVQSSINSSRVRNVAHWLLGVLIRTDSPGR